MGLNYLSSLRGMEINDFNNNIFGNNFIKIEGQLTFNGENQIIIGEALANNLFVRPGDSVLVAVVNPSDSTNAFNLFELKVRGIFSAGYARYDNLLSYTSINTMRKLMGASSNYITTLGINTGKEVDIQKEIIKIRADKYFNRYNVIDSLDNDVFREFNKEKKLISLILYISILLSFLNIYITLNVMVVEKQREIGILRAYGTKVGTIERIFIFNGFLIGLIGALIGVILGLFLTVNIKTISSIIEWLVNTFYSLWCNALNIPVPPVFEIMPKEKFYLTVLPYKINFLDILLQTIGAILSSILAAYFPSRRAAKKPPVEVLRYE